MRATWHAGGLCAAGRIPHHLHFIPGSIANTMSILLSAMSLLCALTFLATDLPSPTLDSNPDSDSGALDEWTESLEASSIPLIGWWGPPPVDFHFNLYRRAFLNWIPMRLRDATTESLDLAQAYGLPVMLELPSRGRFDLGGLPSEVREHSAIVACLIAEEVTPDSAAAVVRRAEALRERVPHWQLIATVLAGAAYPGWEAAAATLTAAGIPVLPIALPFAGDDATEEAELHAVLRGAAKAARDGDAPLWGVVQVTEHGDRRRASESDMRLQAYANLAYGARGLAYFTYWGPVGGRTIRDTHYASFAHAMLDARRAGPQYGHQMARIINAEITLMTPHLEQLTPTGVYFTGDIPEGCEALQPGAGPITRVDSPRAMVGFFRGPEGEDWAMVVNRQHGARRSAQTQASTLGIAFEDEVTAIHVIERQSGLAIPVPVDSGYFTVTTPGGTGNLIRFDREGGDAN